MTDSILRTLFFSVALLLFATADVQAQLTVVSSSPMDGDVNVPLSTVVSVTFSEAIDVEAYFEVSEFYLALEWFPAIPEPTVAGVDQTETVFSALVNLAPDTKYTVLLTGAVSKTGSPLASPYVVTFSTGSTLPQGSVSGQVSTSSSAPVIVALFPDDGTGGLFGEGDVDPAGAVVAGTDGSYQVNYADPGNYSVIGIADVNLDGSLEFETGDAFGMYDAGGDGIVDAVTVAGGNLPGINFGVDLLVPVTARSNAAKALTLARSVATDAQLTSAGADVLVAGGAAPLWFYTFSTAASADPFAVVSLGGLVARGGSVPVEPGGDSFEPLPPDWLDSDDIAAIVGPIGGDDFVTNFPDAEVNAFVTNTAPAASGKTGTVISQNDSGHFWTRSYRPAQAARSGKTATSPTPLWSVFYYSPSAPCCDGFLNLTIHAVTGEVDPALAYYTAARANLDVANAAAALGMPGGFLVMVESSDFGLHKSGVSSDWDYWYLAPANTVYRVRVQEGVVLDEGPDNLAFLRSTQAIPDGWVDSPEATATAEAESGGFRDTYPNAYVQTVLAQGIDGAHPTLTIWEFQYNDGASGSFETIFVNAGTGLVVGTDDEAELPSTLRLDQNYPNPFNPETSINYEVPAGGNVRLLIFDLLGRQVRTLVEHDHAAGRYTAVWDGADENGRAVSSGIYVYRVEAVGGSETRSMTLLR